MNANPVNARSAGQNAYAAYVAAVGGNTYDGKPLPTWDALDAVRQAGWAAAESTPAQKAWWRSKTIWANAVAAALLPLMLVAQDSLGLLQVALGPAVYAWVAFGLAIVNAGLRCITNTAVTK